MSVYDNYSVSIFAGVNDTPIAPSSLGGGNISHFYWLYNNLIGELNTKAAEYDVTSNAIQGQIDTLSVNLSSLITRVNELEARLDSGDIGGEPNALALYDNQTLVDNQTIFGN